MFEIWLKITEDSLRMSFLRTRLRQTKWGSIELRERAEEAACYVEQAVIAVDRFAGALHKMIEEE